jgi:hypothetical protein
MKIPCKRCLIEFSAYGSAKYCYNCRPEVEKERQRGYTLKRKGSRNKPKSPEVKEGRVYGRTSYADFFPNGKIPKSSF